jgi:membrane protease YdiL (CAAX protease family)
VERLVALFEVILCSGYPTQLAVGATLILLGLAPTDADGGLSLQYVVVLSLIDTLLVIALILFFLSAHQERPRDVLAGPRPLLREARLGIPLIFGAFLLAVIILGAIQQFAPGLHTVEENPLQALMRTPRDAVVFGVVVVVAGGVREEIQRGFLLHRFDRWLGGGLTGLIVTSLAFGGGHVPQGLDAVIATACLGAFWAAVYLVRRSIVAPMVSHAGFNLLQLAQFLAIGR